MKYLSDNNFNNNQLDNVPTPIDAGDATNKEYVDTSISSISKNSIGLGNVDNTSDVNKPISTATQAALDSKADKDLVTVDIKEYGAVCDGVTDDTVALQAAVDSGAEVIVATGVVKYTSTIIISNPIKLVNNGIFIYGGAYHGSNPHFSVTSDDVVFSGGVYDANQDIGSIIQFGVSTSGGSVSGITFKNLLSKTELGAVTGDFGCVVLKGTGALVSDCYMLDCTNSDAVTTNDSFPRGVVLTGDDNSVYNVHMLNVRCPFITTGDSNIVDGASLGTIYDNGIYLGGSRNVFKNISMKDVSDEPIVFTGGSHNAVIDVLIDNRNLAGRGNSIGFQSATDILLQNVVIEGDFGNILKTRAGNVLSSATIINLSAKVKCVSPAMDFANGSSAIVIKESSIHITKDTGFDHSYIAVGGDTTLESVHLVIDEVSGYNTTQIHYLYQANKTNSKNVSIDYRCASGYVRDIPYANIHTRKLRWNNNWAVPMIQGSDSTPVKQYYHTTTPTAGTFSVGDIIWNLTPAASGYVGWVCVTAGTPGTWKGFGAIET